jgi:hypothetical protein
MKLFVSALLVGSFAFVACKGESGAPERTAGGNKAPATKDKESGPPTSKTEYTGVDVANGGKISGVVKYAGDKKDEGLKVDKAKCEHAGDPRPEKAILVNDGKVKNAVVRIEGIKQGKKADPANLTLDNKNCEFEPRVSWVLTGSNLVAKNSDPILHNTHLYLSEGNKNLFNIALPNQGQQIEKPLKKAGLVDVKCDAHEWMQAWVVVSDHPYVAVTGDDGSFTLDNVPPGDYTLKIWHEKLGEKQATAKVEAGGTATVDVAM